MVLQYGHTHNVRSLPCIFGVESMAWITVTCNIYYTGDPIQSTH